MQFLSVHFPIVFVKEANTRFGKDTNHYSRMYKGSFGLRRAFDRSLRHSKSNREQIGNPVSDNGRDGGSRNCKASVL